MSNDTLGHGGGVADARHRIRIRIASGLAHGRNLGEDGLDGLNGYAQDSVDV